MQKRQCHLSPLHNFQVLVLSLRSNYTILLLYPISTHTYLDTLANLCQQQQQKQLSLRILLTHGAMTFKKIDQLDPRSMLFTKFGLPPTTSTTTHHHPNKLLEHFQGTQATDFWHALHFEVSDLENAKKKQDPCMHAPLTTKTTFVIHLLHKPPS